MRDIIEGRKRQQPAAIGFKATSAWDLAPIVVESVRTKERRVVVPRGRDGRLLPTGHRLYGDTGTLFAIRFDVDRLTAEGGAAADLRPTRWRVRERDRS